MERFSLATVLSVIPVLWTPPVFIKFVDGGEMVYNLDDNTS